MQKRHLNRSVYLEGTSIVVHRPTSTVNHSSFRHAELVSASGSEPLPIPVLGEILKQVQDDLLDIIQLLSDFQTIRHAELVSASGCEPLRIPSLGEILKQVQDDLLDIVQLLSDFQTMRHAELVSASGSEPLPIPSLGEILKQVQDDLLDIVHLLSDFQTMRHAELVSASGGEPTPIPVLGEILKQVQDDLLDIVQLLSDFQTIRHAELVSASVSEPTPAHFPYLQNANVMLHSYSVYLHKINVIPYFHFSCLHKGNMIQHFHFHTLHRANVVSHLRFAGLKSHKKADKATFHLDASTNINTFVNKTAIMNRFCCLIGFFMFVLGINAQSNDTFTLLPIVTEICVANIDQTIDHSNNYGGWIELYNPTGKDIALDGWYVSDEASVPAKHQLSGYGVLAPGAYQCVFFDHNAADGNFGADAARQVRFKLDRNGGTLYLSANGKDVDFSVTYPESVPRCSYARVDLKGNEWRYCGLPTPGTANAGHYAETMLDLPLVDCDSRLFTRGFNVRVDIPSGTTLRYTLDGSTPTLENGETSTDGRFSISQTTVLRLRLFADGFLPSGIVTRTYIYKDWDYYLPIVAISTDPRNLYDDWMGCYVIGNNGIIDRGSTVRSNLNMDWERPVNFEYLTADGRMIVNQEAGFEVIGGHSRHFYPASFKVKAKKLYDDKGDFGAPLFAGKPYCKYKQLVIRNGGNNNRTDGGPRIKDAITQQALTSSGYYVDAQEYQPVHVFVNGKYLAMMNVREPNNRFHGCANYGYDDDAMDGFEYSSGGYQQKGGDREAFDRLIALSENAGTEAGYAEVCALLDMEEFVRYMAVICYTGSYDWLLNGNNVKGYRTREDGKFHFVLFDQDLTWERTDNVQAIEGVTKNEVLALYNNLKRSKTFCRQFVTSYCILHGSVYTPERCQAVADSICRLVEKALSFDNRYTSRTYSKMKKEMWGEDFRKARIQSLANAYHLGEGMFVNINTNSAKASVHIEGQALPTNSFSGLLFGSVKLRAEAAEGCTFLGWKDQDGQWISRGKECLIEKGGTYTAVYDTQIKADISPVCINEVSAGNDIFVNDYGKRADWIELYNRGEKPVYVGGMYFSDDPSEPTKYRLETVWGMNTTIKPNGRLVIWCDGKAPLTQPHLPFKLKNADGGFLSLQSADGKWKDTIRYDAHSTKETIGRYPDGGCSYYAFCHPTIGKRNMTTMYDTLLGTTPNTVMPHPSSDNIVSVAYYTLDGKRTKPQSGIYIKVVYYRDGHSSASKVMKP